MNVLRTVAAILLAAGLGAKAIAGEEAPPLPRLPADRQACHGVDGYAASFGGRRTFFLKPDQLGTIKTRLNDDPAVKAAYGELRRRADAALSHTPRSVMDKTRIPPSGDRHDYMSLAPYWWPDPANPAGPYIRRDGEVNPERETQEYDRTAIGRMSDDVSALSLAYFYSGDPRYARKAAAMIRTWFLDPATAMNPNARFAQAVPGQADGRAEGVLDTSSFQPVIDAIGLLGPSGALTPKEQAGLESWFSAYIDWMRTSPTGREEEAARNNHGMWFDGQIAQYALFARRPDIARAVVMAFPARRIAVEFDPSGKLPAELTRTRSLHYSIFALMPAYDVAEMAGCLGYDLWNYRGIDGRGLRKATDFLASYRDRVGEWPYQEIRPDPRELDSLLIRARWAWRSDAYAPLTIPYPMALEYQRR